MDLYERQQISDALKTETYKKGDYIINEGDIGDKYYLINEGEAVAIKKKVEGGQVE